MSFEALNDAGRSLTNLIVILNDNEFSISKNVGGLSRYLSQIRTEPAYFKVKEVLKRAFVRIPGIGTDIAGGLDRIKGSVKYLIMQRTLFEDLGFKYFGPIDGHDLRELIRIFSKAKFIKGPLLIHVHTQKGKGYKPAEDNPKAFHCVSSFEIKTGKIHSYMGENYSDVFGKEMLRLAEEKDELIAITAAMRDGTGLVEFSKKYPKRFFDVGIAEDHAVTFAAGMTKGGLIPVFAVYSSFLQRAYDQIIHHISVKDIVKDCGLTRQAFYYHFKDKYDLMNWIYYTETARFMSSYNNVEHWLDGMVDLCNYMRQNRTFYMNALNTTGQNSFQEYLHNYIQNISISAIENIQNTEYDENKWGFTIKFISTAFVGMIVRWAYNGMKEDPAEYVAKMRSIFDGSVLGELENPKMRCLQGIRVFIFETIKALFTLAVKNIWEIRPENLQ